MFLGMRSKHRKNRILSDFAFLTCYPVKKICSPPLNRFAYPTFRLPPKTAEKNGGINLRKYKKVKRKEIIFNLDEWKAIEEKADLLSMKTGTFIKRMSLEGQITCYTVKNVAPIMNALRIIGNNINQIAKKSNETNNIYAEDIEKIRKENALLCRTLNQFLSTLPSTKV